MDLEKVSDHGLSGINFYWTRRERYGITEAELREAGVTDEHAYVRRELIEPLLAANERLKQVGLSLIVKDAYRPAALYQLAYRKLVIARGQALTDALLNMERMPHATGLAVDLGLVDEQTGQELPLRDWQDDQAGGWHEGFYADRQDETGRTYHARQVLLAEMMLSLGFILGSKREIWHFEYRLPAE